MRELAAKVGVSKPAIYRHFTNKEDLLAAMNIQFFNELTVYLEKILKATDSTIVKSSLADLVDYFIQNPSYINYFIVQFAVNEDYEQKIADEFKKREIEFPKFKGVSDEESTFNLIRQFFCTLTILFFVKAGKELIQEGKIQKVPENYAKNLVEIMFYGLKGGTKEGDFLHPEKISEERLLELEKLCRIEDGVLPEENRIFKALSRVIKSVGIFGVTIEKIADEVGMAKSSLYEYFENKNAMIRQLIEGEMNLLATIIAENSAEAKNFTEYLYVMVWTEFHYFLKRPSVIAIAGWLLMQSSDKLEKDDVQTQWRSKMPSRVERPNLGFPYPPSLLTFWFGFLPVSFIVDACSKKWSEEKQKKGIEILMNFAFNGIVKTEN